MAYSYYIYYRVQPEKTGGCELVVRQVMAAVQRATGASGRLLTKRGEANLWMEIYENVTDDAKFEWELAEAAGRLKMQEFLLPGSGRHLECFQEFKK